MQRFNNLFNLKGQKRIVSILRITDLKKWKNKGLFTIMYKNNCSISDLTKDNYKFTISDFTGKSDEFRILILKQLTYLENKNIQKNHLKKK